MFISIVILCTTTLGKPDCSVTLANSTPFYTKKECELSTLATIGSKEGFKCIKIDKSIPVNTGK